MSTDVSDLPSNLLLDEVVARLAEEVVEVHGRDRKDDDMRKRKREVAAAVAITIQTITSQAITI